MVDFNVSDHFLECETKKGLFRICRICRNDDVWNHGMQQLSCVPQGAHQPLLSVVFDIRFQVMGHGTMPSSLEEAIASGPLLRMSKNLTCLPNNYFSLSFHFVSYNNERSKNKNNNSNSNENNNSSSSSNNNNENDNSKDTKITTATKIKQP